MGTGRKTSSSDGLNLAQELKYTQEEMMGLKLALKDLKHVLQVITMASLEVSLKRQKHGTSSKSNASMKKPLKNSKSSKAKTKKQQ